ncbi:MAG: PQQ-binding-like beta-propeller repeat protein [Anaerolineae bacterium]
MYTLKRPLFRPTLIIFALASLVLAACGARGITGNWPGLSTDGKNVYVAYGPSVIAYDVEAQEQLWSFPAESNRALQFFAPPSVQDGRIILGDYGAAGGFFSPGVIVTVYALEGDGRGTPNTLWADEGVADDRIVAAPLQVENRVFVGTANNKLLALDAETGNLLWEFEVGHGIWGQPSFKDGVLYVSSLDRSVHALDAETGSELWQTELGGAIAGKPVTDENLVYVSSFDGKLHALDMAAGQEQWAVEAEDWIWEAPTLDNGVLYFADVKGNVYAVTATGGEHIWSQQIGHPIQTRPVVVGDKVFIASEGDVESEQGLLTALTADTGELVWQTNTPAPLYTTPVVVGDTIVVAMQSETALLMAFNLETGGQVGAPFVPAQ